MNAPRRSRYVRLAEMLRANPGVWHTVVVAGEDAHRTQQGYAARTLGEDFEVRRHGTDVEARFVGDTNPVAAELRRIAEAIDAGTPDEMPLLLTGEACGLHYLVTMWPDGGVTLATRMTPADTWGRPFPLAVA